MTGDRDDIQALARAFARRLEYLREFRGVRYVGAAPIPASADTIEDAPRSESVDAAGLDPQTDDNLRPVESSHSREHPQSPAPDNRSASARAGAPVTAGKSEVERWSAAQKLEYLRERNVGDCRRCPLAKTRRNIVFGVGNPEADVMFVGEAPGADEDRLGEPFVGAAGQRLDQWLTRLGLRRGDVYIANVLKCRPPGNRDPRPEEIERCSPFLHAQIRAIEPVVLIALGRFAGCLLLGDADLRLHQMRERAQRYREPKTGAEIPLFVTYHPSYVIRRERESRGGPPGQARPDHGGMIKSEDQKVFADLTRAVSLVRERS
jgi:uracil-DNA glycosylase